MQILIEQIKENEKNNKYNNLTVCRCEVTIFIFDEQGNKRIDVNDIDKILDTHGVARYAWVLHDKDHLSDGTPKKPHVHIFMNFGNSKSCRIKDIANWFNTQPNFVEKIKTTWEQAVAYTVHAFDQSKYQYDISEVHTYGVDVQECINKVKVKKEKKSDKELVEESLRLIAQGATLREIKKKLDTYNPTLYLKKHKLFEDARDVYVRMNIPTPTWKVNIYIDAKDSNGQSGGIGKSQLTIALAKKIASEWFGMSLDLDKEDDDYHKNFIAKTSEDGKLFGDYEGQPILIWDEMKASSLIHKLGREPMKKLTDDHPDTMTFDKKYSSVSMKAWINIFNGCDDFKTFVDGLAGEYFDKNKNFIAADDKSQQWRRFQINVHLTEDEAQFFVNKGYFEGTREYETFIQVGQMKLKVANILQQFGTIDTPSIRDFSDRALLITEAAKQKAIGSKRPIDEDKGVTEESWDEDALNLLKINDEKMISNSKKSQSSEFVDAEDCPFDDCEQMWLFE